MPLVLGAGLGETAVGAPPAPSGGVLGEALGWLSCRPFRSKLPPPPALLSDATELRALSACLSAASGVDAPHRLLAAAPCDQRGW